MLMCSQCTKHASLFCGIMQCADKQIKLHQEHSIHTYVCNPVQAEGQAEGNQNCRDTLQLLIVRTCYSEGMSDRFHCWRVLI